jgi:hypothetical protein
MLLSSGVMVSMLLSSGVMLVCSSQVVYLERSILTITPPERSIPTLHHLREAY